MLPKALAVGAVILIAGCGDGSDKTLRQLGSSKIDTSQLTSASGDVRLDDERDRRDSTSLKTSELRLRVRDRDALDPSEVRQPRESRGDDAIATNDDRRGKHERKPHQPKKDKHRWFIFR
jgi:hypothetical protein